MNSSGLFLIVSALIAVACGNLFAAIPAAEREALIALYNSTGGPNWTVNRFLGQVHDIVGIRLRN